MAARSVTGRAVRALRWAVGGVALLAAAALVWTQRDAVGAMFARLDPGPAWGGLVLIFLLQAGVAGCRTAVLLRPGSGAGVMRAVRCHALAQPATELASFLAGDIGFKTWCLARHLRRPVRAVVGPVTLDRALDGGLACALVPAALALLTGTAGGTAALALALVGLAAAALGLAGVARWRRRPAWLAVPPGDGRLAAAFGLTVVRYLLAAAAMVVVHTLLTGEGLWLTVGLGLALAQLAKLATLVPGGLGLVEGGWYAVLAAAGEPGGTAIAFALAARAHLVAGSLAAGAAGLLMGAVRPWREVGAA